MNTLDRYRAVSYPLLVKILRGRRARHPLKRVVEPLPEWMQTQVAVNLTERERRQWREWEQQYG